jgi:hypothetical protein
LWVRGVETNQISSLQFTPDLRSESGDRAAEINLFLDEKLDTLLGPYIIIEDSEKSILRDFSEADYVYVHNGFLKNGFEAHHLGSALRKIEAKISMYEEFNSAVDAVAKELQQKGK